ncbi:MAG: tRNA (adenine(22)-N(1))-methyltransferase TrmK, partial [Verrucomicrobiales bacterium]|nr:tRNA (adenine(22)-N(1))-methyltransferase TrmK [Verrucomicrobiales bacterium]
NAQLAVMEQQLAVLRQSTPTRQNFPLAAAPASATTGQEGNRVIRGEPSTTSPAPVVSGRARSSEAQALPGGPAAMAQHGPFKPLDKGTKGGLTDQQEAHLGWLIPRYVAKTRQSKEYTQKYRDCLADPRAVAGFKLNWKEMVYPIVTTRSAGAHLWDLDGQRWLDVTMGFGVNLLGHSPAFVTDAVKRQLDLGVEIGPQSPIVGEVARLICKLTGMERVTFCNTGSEAVMAAIRLCRTVTGRARVALFAGAYHGTFDEVLVKGAVKDGEPKTLAIAPGVAPNLISEVTVLEYGAEASLDWIRRHSGDLAAVLVEPVQSRHPGLQPAAFLREVRRITEASDTPLIFDEVITGFRCHPGGAQAHFGIRADLATYGKIVGGGMPLGFIAGRKEYLDALDGGFWQYGDASFPPTGVTFFAGTFVRHPLAMAAAKAILHHLDERGPALQSELGERTGRMTELLNAYFAEHAVPVRLENFASVWYPRFGAEVKYGSLLYFHLREKGVHIWEGRPCFLSTAHTDEDVQTLIRAFKRSVAEMQAGGFLPGTSDPEFAPASGMATSPETETSAPSADRVATEDRYPVTEAQSELWIASQLGPAASSAFNESCSLELHGPFDEGALVGAIREVLRRHEALRSVFSPEGDFQRFRAEAEVEAEVARHDWSGFPAEEREKRLRALQEAEGTRLFDLTRGPLVAFQCVRLEAERHVLLFTAHHIACDGWSYDIVLRELGHCYGALARKEPIALPPATPFREYAVWEKQQRTTAEGTEAFDFWKRQYASLPPILELPTDRPRPPRRSYQGARSSRTLNAALVQGVRKAGAKQGMTLFGTLLGGYAALLCRLSGTSDLVIGIPAAGQNLIGKEDAVGHCANLLPLRLQVDGDQPVKTLLRTAKQAVLDAFDHQRLTFGALLRELNLPRRPGHVPLVPVIFNLDPPLSEIRFAGLEHEIHLNPRRCYQFDLGFNVVEVGRELVVECDYNTDLFDASTIDRWLEHYEAILSGMAADTEQASCLLDPNSEAQRRRLLIEWNDTRREYPADRLFPGWFAEQAGRTPDAVAAVFGDRAWTYAELDRLSNRLARRLQAAGVGPDRLVGVCVERSLEMLLAVVAVLKAGGAYVPLDPDLPADRLSFMIADADAPVLLTQESLLKRLPSTSAEIVCVDRDASAISGLSDEPVACSVRPEHAAYVIYTSGSTGHPKGVEVLHGGMANLLASMIESPGIRAADRILGLTTLSFDIAVVELLLPLVVGARVVILPRAVLHDPQRLAAVLEDQRITIMQATPASWRMLVDAGWSGKKHLKAITGGEALAPDLARRLLARVGELWNLYGPTETTVYSTFTRIETADEITIGKPVANTALYIVDDRGRPVPIGGIGELWIGGAGVARGYRRRPELTGERFVADPFRPGTGCLVYRTGDLARYRADGRVDYLGRSDFQVKLRGYRIELGEIESALARQPHVRQAVVMAREGRDGEKALTAYVVPDAAPAMEFWMASPIVNGKQIYDDTLYEFMSRDQVRNDAFRAAFRRSAAGKVVLDVGTGKDAILARLAVEAGARKVYAVEILEEPYRQAKELVRRLGLQDRIEVLLGDATRQDLSEKVDVCVAEVIGHIGGEAGLETILGRAARRHLRPGGVLLPHAVRTCVAAVALPEAFLRRPCFGRLAATYVDRVFEAAGAPFDLRLSITGASSTHLASTVGVFEECDLRDGSSIDYERSVRLVITRETRVDGLLLWLQLSLSTEHELDGLANQASWLPVYLPAFQPPLEVRPGDTIEGTVTGRLSANG